MCTLVQALRLFTGRTTHRRSRGIALLFFDHDTKGGEWLAIRSGRTLPPGSVWTGAENLVPTGIRSPDRPARSQSLYRLSYRAHLCIGIRVKYIKYIKFSINKKLGVEKKLVMA